MVLAEAACESRYLTNTTDDSIGMAHVNAFGEA